MRPISRRQIRDSWYAIARKRAAAGDKDGAERARRAARSVDTNDARSRHDRGRR